MANETKTAKRGNGLKFEFLHDGSIKLSAVGCGEQVFKPTDASLEVRHFAELKGWKSTFEDAAAKSRDPITGLSAPLADRFAASVALMKHYADKSVVVWGRKAAAGGERSADAGLTLMALMRVKGVDLAGAEAIVKKMMDKFGVERKDVLANLGKRDDIIRAIADIKAERAAASRVNAVDMLDEIEGVDEEGDEDSDEGDEPDGEAPM